MTEELLINQIKSDIDIVKKDYAAGYYRNNTDAFLAELKRIENKIQKIGTLEGNYVPNPNPADFNENLNNWGKVETN